MADAEPGPGAWLGGAEGAALAVQPEFSGTIGAAGRV